jgi:hypothetical protein
MGTGDFVRHRVRRPRLVGRTLLAGLRHDLEARHRLRALTQRRTDAVGSGVATTDDDDVLAGREDLTLDLAAASANVA